MIASLLLPVVLFGYQGPLKSASLVKQKAQPVVELSSAQKLAFLRKSHPKAMIESAPRIVTLDCLHMVDSLTHADLSYGANGAAWLQVDGDAPGSAILSGASSVQVFIPAAVQAQSYLVVFYYTNQHAPISYEVDGATTNVPAPASAPVTVVVSVPAFSFQPQTLPYSPGAVTFSTSGPAGESSYLIFHKVTIQKVTI